MIAPALIYLSLNRDHSTASGWGVPTATDIAFAVGVLALLGKRVPAALRVLLLALAIIDDIGAIVIIAVFYSGGVSVHGFVIAGAGILGMIAFQRMGVRQALAYLAPASVVWVGMLRAGVHPTMAGVLVGLLTPAKPWFGREGFLSAAGDAVEDFRGQADREDHTTGDLLKPLGRIKQAQREALSPVVRVQAALHPWVAYGVMPLFALANAGVTLDTSALHIEGAANIVSGVVAGLVLGKPVGIFLASFAAVRLGLCKFPRGVGWHGVLLVGTVAGIGFTMALFVAGLAFEAGPRLASAKLAVLVSSALAAAAGLLVGRQVLPKTVDSEAALTVDEAESSTEQ
jgi:NhaA family Na+:H+ antiporter